MDHGQGSPRSHQRFADHEPSCSLSNASVGTWACREYVGCGHDFCWTRPEHSCWQCQMSVRLHKGAFLHFSAHCTD